MKKPQHSSVGRPSLPPGERRRNRFFFSLTDDEMRRVLRAASKAGEQHPAWSRRIVLEAARS